MKKKLKVIEKNITYLDNPKPLFVSVVNYGANQTPFKLLKHLNPIENEDTMKHKIQKFLKDGVSITLKDEGNGEYSAVRKMIFSLEKFATETEVKSHLDDNGWENYQIQKSDEGFEVSSESATEEMFYDVRSIKSSDVEGLTIFIGKVNLTDEDKTLLSKSAEESTEEEAPVAEEAKEEAATEEAATEAEAEVEAPVAEAGVAEVVAEAETVIENAEAQETVAKAEGDSKKLDEAETLSKFDWYTAYYNSDTDFEDLLKSSKDSTPFGYDELFFTFQVSMGNILKSKKYSGKDEKLSEMKKQFSKFSEVLGKAMSAYDDICGMPVEKVVEKQNDFMLKCKKFLSSEVSLKKSEGQPVIKSEELQTLVKSFEEINTKLDTILKGSEKKETTNEPIIRKSDIRDNTKNTHEAAVKKTTDERDYSKTAKELILKNNF
jgi:hypothetical protein